MTNRLHQFIVSTVVLAAIGGAALVSGCVSPRRTGVNNGAIGKLYVATASAILRFGGALQARGDARPEAIFSGNQTQLSAPQRLFVDVNRNRLLVANQGSGSILVFLSASTRSGNPSPDVVLSSPGNLFAPVDLTIDPTAGIDSLYVADGRNILVFTGQSTLSGSVTPTPSRTINFGFPIAAIFLDVANDRLFVADSVDNAVVILPTAHLVTGLTTGLTGTISGPNTLLQHPNGLALDSSGRLMVSNLAGPTITIYSSSGFPTIGTTTNLAPVASLAGSNTQLAGPGQLAFNSSIGPSGELYVADGLAASVLTYLNPGAFTLNFNFPPSRQINGSDTSLNTINGMALDPTR